MTRTRSETEKAAGKLVAEIQKEWTAAMGDADASVNFEVMERSAGLLRAASAGTLHQELRGRSVAQYIGSMWLDLHPQVVPSIARLEAAITEQAHG